MPLARLEGLEALEGIHKASQECQGSVWGSQSGPGTRLSSLRAVYLLSQGWPFTPHSDGLGLAGPTTGRLRQKDGQGLAIPISDVISGTRLTMCMDFGISTHLEKAQKGA